jgi:hypothetical protein
MIESSNFKTEFTQEYCEHVFHDALCNGLDYVQGYGIILEYDANEYKEAKSKLESPCYEDVLMQILRDGNKLYFTDYENDDDSLNVEITLETVRERVNKLPHWAKLQLIEEQDDADTADAVLQTVAYDDIIFG